MLAHASAFAQNPALTPRSEPAHNPAARSDSGASAADEGERALERTLTRESVLVLPRGVYELEPAFEYTYKASDALQIVNLTGTPTVARQNVKQDRLETRLTLRAGLPYESHVELRVPYVFLRNDQSTAGQLEQTDRSSGFGDLQIGFTRQLVDERTERPGLLASATWRAPTGDFHAGEPSVGSGFHTLQGALTLVKRQDPLVFFGTGSYTAVLERRHDGAEIDPGDSFGLKFGTILAASPRTSIRGNFEVNRAGRTQINGSSIPGTDTAVATLQFGLATLLSRQSLLDVQVSIGLTPDAPNFALIVALPFRFQ